MMMRRTLHTTLAAFLLIGLWANPAQAQNDRSGTAGASYLLVPNTARTVGLGTGLTSGLSDLNAIEAVEANPAALTVNDGTSALFSRMEYVADIGVNSFGVAQSIGPNQVALSLKAWDFGDIVETTANQPQGGDTFSPTTFVLGLSYARQFTDRISAGVTVNGLSEEIADMRSFGASVDAGMTYVVGESGLRFGVSLKNFGPQKSFAGNGLTRTADVQGQPPQAGNSSVNIEAESHELPSMLNFGAAYKRNVSNNVSATLIGNFRSNSYDMDQYSGGLEFGFMDLLFVRGSYQMANDMDFRFWQGYNLGAGLNLEVVGTDLKVDYAYRGTDLFDDVQIITAGVTL